MRGGPNKIDAFRVEVAAAGINLVVVREKQPPEEKDLSPCVGSGTRDSGR